MTVSNPTTAGFELDLSAVASALAAGVVAPYQPEPTGILPARQAVSDYYQDAHNIAISPDNLVLTVSTSEAYSFLFRLLCDPGDEVLYLQPGYPLFDYLADLDAVTLKPVSWLRDADGWHLDRGGLESSLTERTRAVLIVHPNNPTGHYTSASDRQWLDQWCGDHSLALIVDEVFLDYSLVGAQPSFLAQPADALTFVLSGVSKISGLPQMKVAWIALHGPTGPLREVAARLEVIADTFLSLSTPQQLALTEILAVRRQIQPQILDRVRANLAALDGTLEQSPQLSRHPIQGGWYAALQIPAHESSEASAVRLMRETGIYVHPGSFFGFEEAGVWVLSLLTPTATFAAACRLIAKHLAEF